MESLLHQFQVALRQGSSWIMDWVMDKPIISLFMAAVIIVMWRLLSPTVRNKS